MELFDVIDSKGNPTGQIVSREKVHAEGIPHRTAHIWIIREKEGRVQILLQKRSQNKDSFPGKFDTSSAGHIQAGDEPLESALRELKEELGTGTAAFCRNLPNIFCKRIPRKNVPGRRDCICLYFQRTCKYRRTYSSDRRGRERSVV